jgi:hypothetical protein
MKCALPTIFCVFDTTLTKPIDNLSARAMPTPRFLASPFGLCTASCREAANHEEQNTGSAEDKLGLPDLDHAKAAVLASLGFSGIANSGRKPWTQQAGIRRLGGQPAHGCESHIRHSRRQPAIFEVNPVASDNCIVEGQA